MSHSKLLLFSIIAAVTRAAGIFCWDYHASLPSRVTETAHRKQRLHTPFHWNRERLSQPLGNFILLWLMLSARYLKSASRARARWECLHCTCALHCTLLGHPLPITHRAHFLITDCHLDKAQLQPSPSTQHSQRRKDRLFQFSFQLKVNELCDYCSFISKIELFCKYTCRKDQNSLFFLTDFRELQHAVCRILLLQMKIGVRLSFRN